MRCFIAIDLSEAARDHLARLQDRLRILAPKFSYTSPAGMHLTLRFLGQADKAQLSRLGESMKHVRVESPITLHAESGELFPPDGPLRVVAVRLAGDESKLRGLQKAIDQRCRYLKFPDEDRDYRPHVTLARVKTPVPFQMRSELVEAISTHLPGPDFVAEDFVLYESRLTPQGAQYRAIERFK